MFSKNLISKLLWSLLLLFSSFLVAEIYFDERYQQEAQLRYEQTTTETDRLLNTVLQANHEKVSLEALYLSQDPTIKKALLNKDIRHLDFDKVFAQRNVFTTIKEAYVQLIDAEGYSLYRSWVDKKGDNIVQYRKDLQVFFKEPKVMNTLSVGLFDFSMKTIVPIYEGDRFLGAFEVIRGFAEVYDQLENADLIPLILVNPSYKSQLLNIDGSQYLNDAYVVKYPKDLRAVQAFIKKKLDQIALKKEFYVCEDTQFFVSFKHLYADDASPLATIYLFQPLEPIQLGLSQPKLQIMGYLFGLFLAFWLTVLGVRLTQKYRLADKDISSLKTAVMTQKKALQTQNLFWQKVIDGLNEMVLVIRKSDNKTLMNKTAAKILPYRLNRKSDCALCALALFDENHTCPEIDDQCAIKQAYLQKKEILSIEEIGIQGNEHFIEFRATPVLDKRNEVVEIIEVGHDITSYMHTKKELEQQKENLDEIAYYDTLTGLPNRRLFMDRLQQAISLAQRSKNKLVVMFIDLDFFKQINDTYGHEIGDEVLIAVAKRLKNQLRVSDTVARLGGDEFTVMLEQVPNTHVVIDLVNSILSAIREPLFIENHVIENTRFFLTTTVGISVYPDDGVDSQSLIKHADIAMYQAKEKGRDSYAFYNPSMTEKAMQRLDIENKLRLAIEHNQFEVFYQPQFDLHTNSLTGFEALVRWHHPDLGLVLPAEFIVIAEESGLIVQIGEMVMLEAMQSIAKWHKAGLTDKRMAINISAKQFANEELLQNMKWALKKTQCRPEWIELEITETSVMKNKVYAANVLNELKKLGITVAIDDFGTGYSSLAELKRMPIDKIKIDQSFVFYLPYDHEGAEITKTIIAMGQSLKMQTIAEGIENAEQVQFLQANSCGLAQGNFYSEPMSAAEIEARLEQGFKHPA